MPTSLTFPFHQNQSSTTTARFEFAEDDAEYEKERDAIHHTRTLAVNTRKHVKPHARRADAKMVLIVSAKIKPGSPTPPNESNSDGKPPSIISVIRSPYPTIPRKPVLLLGLLMLFAKCEVKYERAREYATRGYYEVFFFL